MVDLIGNNLGIIISCNYNKQHNWMSFSAWYSISKKMPDAKVAILCKRGYSDIPLFRWCYKLNLRLFYDSKTTFDDVEEVICIPPSVIALRGYLEYYDEGVGPESIKSSTQSTFVDYSSGCGRYALSDEPPFQDALRRFGSKEININELRTLEMWNKMYIFFTEVNV